LMLPLTGPVRKL